MNRKVCVLFVLLFLLVFAVSSLIVRGASQVELTPTSGAPADSIHVDGSEFAASKSVGIGLGPQVAVVNEVVTVDHPAPGNTVGFTSKHPIKPGSFRWSYLRGGGLEVTVHDDGHGTLIDPTAAMASGSVNYATGFFNKTMSYQTETTDDSFNYTTYEFDATPSGFAADGSGVLSGNFTVPDIWNGTEPLTVIDEAGNMATADFTTYGSDVVPEAFTVGAFVLLTSTAIVVSFYWLKKKPSDKMVKYS